VTPSFNQGQFLEETIQSVLSQDYPNLEYMIIDGGSTDESIDILHRYESRLTYWQSSPDGGQYEAINAGFARTDGEIMAWINSDDKYTPWAFSVVAEIFLTIPEIEWITTLYPLTWDAVGRAVACGQRTGYTKNAFLKGRNIPGRSRCPEGTIQQESTFWRRSLWNKAGATLDTSLKLAADFALWARFFQHADLYGVNSPLGGYRQHQDQKTNRHLEAYADEAEQVLSRYGRKVERPATALLHRLLRQVRCPQKILKVGTRLGMREPRNICVHLKNGWSIKSR